MPLIQYFTLISGGWIETEAVTLLQPEHSSWSHHDTQRVQLPWSYANSLGGCLALHKGQETGESSTEESWFYPRGFRLFALIPIQVSWKSVTEWPCWDFAPHNHGCWVCSNWASATQMFPSWLEGGSRVPHFSPEIILIGWKTGAAWGGETTGPKQRDGIDFLLLLKSSSQSRSTLQSFTKTKMQDGSSGRPPVPGRNTTWTVTSVGAWTQTGSRASEFNSVYLTSNTFDRQPMKYLSDIFWFRL